MATAQYDTRTRMVEETVVVLTLTEEEADALKDFIGASTDGTRVMMRVFEALAKPTQPEQPAPAADTFEYDGVTYDLATRYHDRDGDVWRFERRPDGAVRGRLSDDPIGDHNIPLGEAVDRFGPMKKVTS
ncbi:phiSA1p31-related protein [Streptomyces sp. NPDC057509]|uniref:phiSA1p31-related protein n=1 Tax=Streptomyces sp. NPDC057509 TaxID=3346152 RepID=UPI0036B21CF8